MPMKIIVEDCIACGACVIDCPNDGISVEDEVYVVHPDICTECVGYFDSPRCVATCPVECIILDEDYQESREELLAKKERNAAKSAPESSAPDQQREAVPAN